MSEEVRKKAIEMLLSGATLLSEPCPYCKGVRVMKDGDALCVSCGKSPDKELEKKNEKPQDESPVKKGVFWAGTNDGLVHISQDNGKTWENVTNQQ